MPNYDYKCDTCGNVFEKFHGMSETPNVSCTKCGEPASKMFSPGAGIVFKGAGFYVNDYKNNPATTETKSSEKPATGCATGACAV